MHHRCYIRHTATRCSAHRHSRRPEAHRASTGCVGAHGAVHSAVHTTLHRSTHRTAHTTRPCTIHSTHTALFPPHNTRPQYAQHNYSHTAEQYSPLHCTAIHSNTLHHSRHRGTLDHPHTTAGRSGGAQGTVPQTHGNAAEPQGIQGPGKTGRSTRSTQAPRVSQSQLQCRGIGEGMHRVGEAGHCTVQYTQCTLQCTQTRRLSQSSWWVHGWVALAALPLSALCVWGVCCSVGCSVL